VARRGSGGRVGRPGCGARVVVADGRLSVAPLRVRPFAAAAARAAPRDRRRGRGRCHGRIAGGRRGHVRGDHAGQRADAQHPHRRRLQRHADASRIARDASRSKRGGGRGCRPRRRERSGGRRAVRPSRHPSRQRRGRVSRSALIPPAEAGGVSPRAAGPCRRVTGRRRGAAAGGGGGGVDRRARAGPAGGRGSGSRTTLLVGVTWLAVGRAPGGSTERTGCAGASSCFVLPDDGNAGRRFSASPAAGASRHPGDHRAASGGISDAAAPSAADRIAAGGRSNGRPHVRCSAALRAHGSPPDAPAWCGDSSRGNDARSPRGASAA
jgi:hypothetical protein